MVFFDCFNKLQTNVVFPANDGATTTIRNGCCRGSILKYLSCEIQNIEFHSGIPDDISEDYFLDTKVNNLIVLDDLMTEVKNDTRIGDIFSRGRHKNTSVILLLLQDRG
jgi:hypothetical protein